MSTPLLATSVPLDIAQSHYYDVIIVGAGPAGSSAAYHLATRGVDVLLVDKAQFPRDKCCGDAVMPLAIAKLERLGLGDEMQKCFTQVEHVGVWQREQEREPVNTHALHIIGEGGRGYVGKSLTRSCANMQSGKERLGSTR